jgi:ligand-binding sensor domain-containing protein
MRRAAFALFCVAALADQLPTRIYTTADGLAGNTIDRIVRDSHGYLWFCTREGLSRFDGYQFRNFGAAQGLPALDSDLLETPAGDYWVATGDGIARFRPADPNPRFTIFRAADALGRVFHALALDPAGGVWAGSGGGLYHLDPPRPPDSREWRLRFVDIGLPRQNFDDAYVEALLVDRHGNLWVGARSGLYRRSPDGRTEGTRGGPPYPDVRSLLEDHAGRLWAGTREGVCRIQPDRGLAGRPLQDVCVYAPELAGQIVHFLHESADGLLWTGSNGLLRARGPGIAGVARYSARNGLPGEGTPLLSGGEDIAGNLWVGGFGAVRIAKGGFRTYSGQDGLDSDHIASIFEDRNGELCVVSEGAGGRMVNRFDGRRFHTVEAAVPPAVGWGWGAQQIALEARNREWWIATAAGMYRFAPLRNLEQLGRTPPRAVYGAANSVYAVFEDAGGGVWMSAQVLVRPGGPAHANALARWDPATGALRRFSDADGAPLRDLATSFAEDRTGAVWIGLSRGSLARYADGKFRMLPPPAGGHPWVNALHADRSGKLWVATNSGVSRLDPIAADPRPVTFTTADGLATNDVECITEDLQGRVSWRTSELRCDMRAPREHLS